MINITLGVVLGSPSMKYPKNGFKTINITQIPKMNPARGFCFIVYCGMTKRKFSDRMSEHRDYAKFNKNEEPSGEHFNTAGHSFHNLQGLAVEQVRSKDPFI